jgi:hypothetical protein
MNLIQIVPGLPPLVDGIGDYSLTLARRLRDDHGIDTTFLVVSPAWSGTAVEGFPAIQLSSPTPAGLITALAACESTAGAAPVLLQFAVYGYQKRGCPFWLLRAFRSWCAQHPGRLHIAFHELEVSGSNPLSSTFWVPPVQRHILLRLAALGNFRYMNNEQYRGKLESWGAGRLSLILNFSTIGEPAALPPFSARRRDLIVFGRAQQRQWTYERGREVVREACRRVAAERIIDIGAPIATHTVPEIDGIPVLRLGRLDAAEVSHWMSTSIAAVTHYPAPLLTKSSVHAVSCAHGTPLFLHEGPIQPRSCPGLITGEDFLTTETPAAPFSEAELAALSEKVYTNYQARSSRVAAATIARGIFHAPAGEARR